MSDSPKQVCMYVCLRLLSMYVCMYVSLKPTKSACFGGCQIPREKRSVFDHQFNFLRFVRGGTSGRLARRQTCMYVCLSSRRTLSMYVCMSDSSKQVCMYVWGSWACIYVCMSHSKLQNQHLSEGIKFLIKTLQYSTFNSFFFDLWGGVLPRA